MAVTGLTLLLVALHRRGWAQIPTIAPLGLSVIGATLSIFAAFRNSASYERWWEARKVAGLIVVEARSLARQAQNYIAAVPGDDLSRRIALRCIAFMQLTRDFLRNRPIGEDSAPYLSSDGCIVDQPFQPRLPDGMIRCYMGTDRVVGFGHQFIKALIPPPPERPDSPAAQPGPKRWR